MAKWIVPDAVYDPIKSAHGPSLTPQEKSMLLVGATERELARGTKHFHPVTGEQLHTVEEVIRTLNVYGGVDIQLENTDDA